MNLPDRIFALGGAGKAIAYKLLSSEWILEEVLRPKERPDSLTVTIIDTAEGEEGGDSRYVQELREDIATKKSELRDASRGRTGSITLDYKLVTDDIQLNSSLDLVGEEAVKRITAGNGMERDNWWISADHINENLDFAKGVVRKRGLGKAIYYKAYAEDDSISTYIDLPSKGKVAILAGIGGGTGSGLVIDLARHLKRRQSTAEITLFSVLPNHTEGPKESANAYAALSELEALCLNNEQVFKDRIMVPIGPTGYDGKKGHQVQTEQVLEELDEAFIYLLTAYYSTDLEGLEDPFEGAPQYAPFTIGIPQVLRFKIEAINDSRERLREILDTKDESLQAEQEVYDTIDRFLSSHYPGASESGLRDADEADIRDRMTDVERLLRLDLFKELDYQSISIFDEQIADAEAETDDIAEQIEIVSGAVSAVDPTENVSGSFVDNIDMQLAETAGDDIKMLGRRKNLFEQKSLVDDSKINGAIEYLLGNDDGSPFGVRLQTLETQLEEYTDRRDRLQSELEDTERELEEIREKHEETVNRQTNDWERATAEDFDQLQTIEETPLESDLTTLRTALEDFQTEVVNADSEDAVENIARTEVTNAVEAVEDDLDTIGTTFEDANDIKRALEQLKNARIAFLERIQEESTVESIVPWESSTAEQREEALKNYRRLNTKLSNGGVFTIGTPSGTFSAELEYSTEGVRRSVKDRAATLHTSISDALRERLEDPDPEAIRELETILSENPTVEATREVVARAFRSELEGVDDVQRRKEDIESDLAAVKEDVELYESTVDLLQDLKSRRDQFVDRLGDFRSARATYEEDADQPVADSNDDYVYIKQVKPEDVFRATGDVDIAESELLKSNNEEQRTRGYLEELVSNTLDQQYHGLKHRKFERDRERYDELKIRTAIISRALDQVDPDTVDFENTYSDAFNLGASGTRVENRFTSWTHNSGDRWDVALGVFVQGVFLDNLRKMVQPDGYKSGYETRQNELSGIHIHHSFGLENGYYVRRSDLLNVEDSEDVEFYLRPEPEIVSDLRDEYVSRVPVDGQSVASSPDVVADSEDHE